MPDGDLLTPIAGELTQVLRHRIIERHQAALHAKHRRTRCDDDFGDGGHVKDRILGHRLRRWSQSTLPISLLIGHTVALHPEGRAHDFGIRDRISDGGIQLSELLRVEDLLDGGTSGIERFIDERDCQDEGDGRMVKAHGRLTLTPVSLGSCSVGKRTRALRRR